MDDLDALLADLQNSVPGHQTAQPQYSSVQSRPLPPINNYSDNTPGYGSLRGKSAQPQVYQEHYSSETRSKVSPENGHSSSHSYQNQNAINYHKTQPTSTSISELDSLLEDLSIARHNNSNRYDPKSEVEVPPIYSSPISKYNNYNTYATVEERPSVDSLLNELDSAHIYAVPHNGHKSPPPGRHVTITVRETTTEKVTGPDGAPVLPNNDRYVHKREAFNSNHQTNNTGHGFTSQATRELDELMASLSDIKDNGSRHHHQQEVSDYALPTKGTSHLVEEEHFTSLEHTPDPLSSMLSVLETNMSRQTTSTVQKGCCNACEKPIVGQVITALGKTWHPEHFTCNHCNQELGTRNFFERDGFPYCEQDYHNLFSPRCAYCNGAILDKCVTALDKTWHTEHFFCAQCGQQFGEDGFHERDGKPYCRNDYFEMFAPKCNGCNRAIMENYISALNSQWHPDCFVCRECKKAVRGKSFYAIEGKPVCPGCAGINEEA